MKRFNPIPNDVSEGLKWIKDEIETLKSISLKSKYVIDYLDSFVDTLGDDYQVYHIVNSLYEVNNWTA